MEDNQLPFGINLKISITGGAVIAKENITSEYYEKLKNYLDSIGKPRTVKHNKKS